MSPVTARRRLAVLVVLATAVGGCLDAPVPSTSPTPQPTPQPTPVTTTFDLGTTVWYEGLLIHVDNAVATLDERGGPVEVRLRLENPGDEEGELDARIFLDVDGSTGDPPLEPTRESKVPIVPAHGLVGAVMTYELQGVASADRAVVLFGEAPLHVARVPLTSEGGTAQVFEPVQVTLSNSSGVKDLRLTLRSALLRWDLPDWSQELTADLQALTVTYDATYLGTFAGGFAFTGDNVRLRLPDGTRVAPRRDGHSQSIELIGARQTKRGLSSRFEIPAGTVGRFALIVQTNAGAKAIPFVLGA